LHIYLTGYAGSEEGYRVTLLVVHDPGYGPVLIAGFLLLIGLTVSLNFPPVRVQVQGDAEGILLTGRCERRAWEFEREFSAIVGEAQQYVNSWGRG
ncbi:MAG: cytochrome c biogenesis protein ResB, partial [Anaerolineae bacterium]|nr:cytochrome c biogenesis protein ResB [Anaerolineae bacterium]